MKGLPMLRLWLLALLLAACAARAEAPQTGLPVVELDIAGHKLTVEVAATPESRNIGLMHRRMLPEDRGMLFVFPVPAIYSMWMANTHIPLSVAYLDPQGRVINIRDMPPLTHSSYSAGDDALYAIETNQGWFAKRGIGPGTLVKGLPRERGK
ncbi:MAG TPA: DUF192 domain-containing protein [Burkholderiales bacterium]|nr:DUF192 domain-containing protein [Burkholderiales bacterium]